MIREYNSYIDNYMLRHYAVTTATILLEPGYRRELFKLNVSVNGSGPKPQLCVHKSQRLKGTARLRAQEGCESRGGRPGLPVPNSPYGLCGRKATVNTQFGQSSGAVRKSRWPSWSPPVPSSPYGLNGRKATLDLKERQGRRARTCSPTTLTTRPKRPTALDSYEGDADNIAAPPKY